MNARQANRISIRNYLNSIGISPVRSNKRSSLYLASYRQDKHPSLKVSHKENLWIDYGNDNKGGTLIDLVLLLNPGYDVSDAIRDIENSSQSFFSFHQQNNGSAETANSKKQIAISKRPTAKSHQQIAINKKQITNSKQQKTDSGIFITKLQELGINPVLTSYLNTRGIQLNSAKPFCSEIYFTVNGQKYFGIANKNNHGWNIRNEYWKGCTAQGYSHYKNDKPILSLFEGIFDLLSFIELNKSQPAEADFLVLNSLVNLKKACAIIEGYKTISLYLDHDVAGRKATQYIMHQYPGTRDRSDFYSSFKDLNDYHLIKDKEQLLIKNQ